MFASSGRWHSMLIAFCAVPRPPTFQCLPDRDHDRPPARRCGPAVARLRLRRFRRGERLNLPALLLGGHKRLLLPRQPFFINDSGRFCRLTSCQSKLAIVIRGSLARCGAFSVLGDAAAQCLHEIDHPVRRGKGRASTRSTTSATTRSCQGTPWARLEPNRRCRARH